MSAHSKRSGHEKVTIKIPRALYDRLGQIVDGTGFNSVTDFVVYVLRDLASTAGPKVDVGLTAEELDAIRQRLKALGYF